MGRGLDLSDVGGLLAALIHAAVILLGVGLIVGGVGYLIVKSIVGLF